MQIARSIEASSVITVKQKMVALIDENPDAFIDGNMNLMRQGAILRIPSERSMGALDKNQVADIYEAQLRMTIVCGDSHTATHGALGALAFGIGKSEVEHVLATQCHYYP